jgi:YaiO family outer membrane protein
MKKFVIRILVGFCFVSFYAKADAQINVDSIFQVAETYAKEHHYMEALHAANLALQADPKRGDILVFVANVYSWKNQNDSALIFLQKANDLHYQHDDLYATWLNVLLRSHQYQRLLRMCDDAEQHAYSDKEDLLHKRLIAYADLKEYTKAIQLAEKPENKSFIKNGSINGIVTDLFIKRNTNILSAYYTLDWFDHFTPQHLASVDYSTKLGQNTFVVHTNFAHRFQLNDVQLESDFYLYVSKKQYMYFNYGYGFNASLFPRNRIGYEYYVSFNHGFEASLGGRYMQYPISKLFIATAHVGKYVGKSWFSIRPFYVIKKGMKSLSFIGDYRLYGENQFNYWSVEVGFGNSPDDMYATSQTNGFNQLNAYKILLAKNILINRVSEFHLGLGYTREEYSINQYRNRYTLEAGYKIHLK